MNSKYPFLNNDDWLKDQLIVQKKTVMKLATELALATGFDKQSLHGCITFRKNRWPQEDQDEVKRGRRPSKPKTKENE